VKNKTPLILTAALVAVCIPVLSSHGEDGLKKLMAKKLENSQKVLAGLALNDYDLVAKHADELIQISKAAEWRVLKTPQYEANSNDFRRAAETMIQQAKAKNTDGIALAYVDMTLTCVRCHKYVRETRMARLDVDH
jgi:glutamate/tyrosine decarboxylase-like PLP-dependent enzyme